MLRFVQHYRPENREKFMRLEAEFAAMEQRRDDMPKGRRSQPYAGRLQNNTLVWECVFPSLEAAREGLARIDADPEHARLFRKQAPYMEDAYTEIYEILEF